MNQDEIMSNILLWEDIYKDALSRCPALLREAQEELTFWRAELAKIPQVGRHYALLDND